MKTAKYIVNSFITAFQEQLEIGIEKKSPALDDIPSTLHQRFGRAPKRSSMQSIRKNPVEEDGKRMIWKLNRDDDHLMKDFQQKSSKEFALHRIRNDVSAVHVIHELAG